jgi:hypothetical protein
MASRYVGIKGDLRAAIFVDFEGVEDVPFALVGVEGGERFWMRAERRGVVGGESICNTTTLSETESYASLWFYN